MRELSIERTSQGGSLHWRQKSGSTATTQNGLSIIVLGSVSPTQDKGSKSNLLRRCGSEGHGMKSAGFVPRVQSHRYRAVRSTVERKRQGTWSRRKKSVWCEEERISSTSPMVMESLADSISALFRPLRVLESASLKTSCVLPVSSKVQNFAAAIDTQGENGRPTDNAYPMDHWRNNGVEAVGTIPAEPPSYATALPKAVARPRVEMPAARKNYNDECYRPSLTGGVGGEGGCGTKGNGGTGGLGQATQMSLDAVTRFSEICGGTGGKGGMGYANGGNGGTGEGNVFGRRIVEGKPRQPRKLVNTLTLSAAILKLLVEEGYDTVIKAFFVKNYEHCEDELPALSASAGVGYPRLAQTGNPYHSKKKV
ncbi:hypothetical protein C8R47DRAFT_1075676 [Mycena vitilis]|nr:hypothetical protein C8R47DRAFT_1075676 [Mycena vitilis]